jgi:hypothetical protein
MYEHELLRLKPTVRRWQWEIRRIVFGERESDLQQIGGVQQYVDRILVDSDDRSKAETAFLEGLTNVVRAWRPAVSDPYSTGILLELIATHTPRFGFRKVLGYLAQWDRFTPEGSEEGDIHSVALVALQSYYPVPPPRSDHDNGFRAYEELLWKHLDKPGYQAHALRRLLELGVLDPDDPVVGGLIAVPDVIRSLLRDALGPRRAILQGMIGSILAHCLLAGPDYDAYDQFKKGLLALGAQLIHGEESPFLEFPDGTKVELLVPASAQARYMQVRDSEIIGTGISKVMMIVAEVEGDGTI